MGEKFQLADEDGIFHLMEGKTPMSPYPETDVAHAVRTEPGFEFLNDFRFPVAVQLIVDAGLNHPDVEDAVADAVGKGVESKPLADDVLPRGEDLALGEALGETELTHNFLKGVADGLRTIGLGRALAVTAPLGEDFCTEIGVHGGKAANADKETDPHPLRR